MYFQFLCFCFDFVLCNTSSESSLGLTNVTCRDVESNFIYFESFKHFQNLTNPYSYILVAYPKFTKNILGNTETLLN